MFTTSLIAWACLTTTVVLWGTAFVAIRAALRAFSPGELSFLRIGIAAAALCVALLPRRVKVPRVRDVTRICAMAIVGITAYQLLLSTGEVDVPAATASFLIAVAPVLTALLARLFLGERLSPVGWLGVGVAFAGTAVVALGQSGSFKLSTGAVIVLAAAGAQATFFVLQKPLLATYSPLEVTCYAMWIGVVPLVPFARGLAAAVQSASPFANLSVLWLGVGASAIAFVTWARALRDIPLAVAASALYLCPVVAAVSGWLVLDEVPTVTGVAGGLAIVGGVVLVTTSRRPDAHDADR